MPGNLAELWVAIGAKLDNFNKGMSDVDRATQRMGRRLDKVGKQMTMRVTLPLLALGGAAVKMSADFDKGMTESLAIMDNVSPAMRAEMEKTAKQMSEESTFASKELAGSYFYLASAGMDAAQSIKALPVVTKFAQAGTFNLALATDLLTDAQSALGLSSKNAEKNQKNLLHVSDVLVKANTLANASVQQFSEALTNRAGPALRTVGKDVEEGVAVLAAFADQGRKGGEAGEALSIVMRDLQRAALGHEAAFEKVGVTVYDASGEMVNMADIIGDLEKLFEGMSDKQKKATMTMLGFQERSQANILTLIGTSDKIRTYEKELRRAGGTTETVSKKQLQAFSNQMTVLRNKLMNVGIQIGDILIPIVKDLVDDHIAPAVKWFSNLSESSKIMTIKFAGIAAATGPLLYGFAKLLIILPKLRVAFALMTGPIGIMIAAATTLGIVLGKVIDGYKAKQDAEMDAMVEAGKGHAEFWAFRKRLIEDEIVTVEEWKVIYEKHGKNYQRVMRAIATLPEYKHIRDKWEELKKAQDAAKESGKGLASTLEDEIAKALGKVAEKQKTWIDYLKDLGLMTLQEKQDRVIELTGYLDKIHQAYRDGKLAIDDYRSAVSLTNAEILALSTTITETALPASRDMTGILEQVQSTLESQAFTYGVVGKAAKKRAVEEMSMFEKIGTAAIIALGQSKAGAIAQAIMSTYAGAAKTIEMLGMPFAIPFIAMAILTGMKQVASIRAQSIPSAQRGAWVPRPMPVMAGHGPEGELILPVHKMKEMFAGAGAGTSRFPSRIYFDLTTIIGTERFKQSVVKVVNEASDERQLRIRHHSVVN